jgi:hypothetical protein
MQWLVHITQELIEHVLELAGLGHVSVTCLGGARDQKNKASVILPLLSEVRGKPFRRRQWSSNTLSHELAFGIETPCMCTPSNFKFMHSMNAENLSWARAMKRVLSFDRQRLGNEILFCADSHTKMP